MWHPTCFFFAHVPDFGHHLQNPKRSEKTCLPAKSDLCHLDLLDCTMVCASAEWVVSKSKCMGEAPQRAVQRGITNRDTTNAVLGPQKREQMDSHLNTVDCSTTPHAPHAPPHHPSGKRGKHCGVC